MDKDYPDFEAVIPKKGFAPPDPDRKKLPVRDHSKLELPHIEGNEVEIIHADEKPAYEPEKATSWDGREITLVGRGVDES